MVAVTRAAAARQQQLSNEDTLIVHGVVTRKIIKKKKKIIRQHASSCVSSSSLESDTITSVTIDTLRSVNASTTESTSLANVELSDHQNNNNVVDVNDIDQYISLPSIELNQINNNQQDKLCNLDGNEESDSITAWPITVGEIQWCKTNRGNDRIFMSGYSYDYMSQSLKKNIRSFRCSKKGIGCRAVVYVSIDSNMYKDSNNVEHNHPPDHHNVKRLLILQKVKERIMIEPTSVTRIIEDEYVKHHLDDGDRRHFLLPAAQASRFHKIRAKMIPPNPKSLDFEVPELYSTTHSGEEFLIYDSTHKKIGGSCEVIFIDGTFKTRPMMFSQVYVIMGLHLAEAIPLVWCLAPKRVQEVYEKILKILKQKSIEYGTKFEPQYVYSDFESGEMGALKNLFPNVTVRGCWYHFNQAIFRNIQKMGLTTMQWLTRTPPKYWNLGPIHIRCNNSLEGYNNRLQYRFGIHPRLWSFIHFLKGEESLVMMRVVQIRNGIYRNKALPFSACNERLAKKTKQIKNLSRLFEYGSITLTQYITNLSAFVGEAATKKKKKNNDSIYKTTIDSCCIDDDNI
ncbi:unnamed protein product [Rotaria magnacalcarata]|uniref:MULE transposase domain-containing protein n=1 Tax=Rotaria magnacalcarata TaxID=392030 RepID=A0A817ANL3_9BILA|nr:unnamed protein product [Rotaria magnacalcarata]CAF2258792.1 unnamed protein product [Rotaria magnacalcarata]CAF3997159.1 unnamed protein product [Rotaria magnacalcarata]CAF4313510.1 unnamed protein product [Rotaria magnacalcarata]CAF4314417.1 unnamed protein product [Rotaria magnacalcarata]